MGHIGTSANVTAMVHLGTSANVTNMATVATDISNVNTVASNIGTISAKAPIASPTFTGTPAGPTAGAGTNTTQLATTAFVQTAATNAANAKASKGFATAMAIAL